MYKKITQNVLQGKRLNREERQILAHTKEKDISRLMAGADRIRRTFFGNQVRLCAINNAKSGKCAEDCRFCAQSHAYATGIATYPLKSPGRLAKACESAALLPLNRYGIVTSGGRLPRAEVGAVAEAVSMAMAEAGESSMAYCASLGLLDEGDFAVLSAAGITRYHHNLETSQSHFDKICTSHSYAQRRATIKKAKAAGMSVCAGGIFGIGETAHQVVELALDLSALDVDAVPVNFLTPVKGTPLAHIKPISAWACLKVIALLRYLLPQKEIIVCGGRLPALGRHHPKIFAAGATGLMTGDYLTTQGNQIKKDLEMIETLGLVLDAG